VKHSYDVTPSARIAIMTTRRSGGLFGGLFGTSCVLDVSLLDDIPALIAQLDAPQPSRALVETRDSNGYTLLHHAAKNGNIKAAKVLLEKGGTRFLLYWFCLCSVSFLLFDTWRVRMASSQVHNAK